MKFCIIGSGSSGNATLVVAGETRILVDVGFSAKETVRRLREIGQEPKELTGILITHEHGDHVGGMPVLARQLGIPVHIAKKTRGACKLTEKDERTINWGEDICSSLPLEIGKIFVYPISVPHDAADPIIFTLESDGVKIGIVTDLGYVPAHVANRLLGCKALILEANHDREMLKVGKYSWELKQRIASRVGHLSNDEMGRFLSEDFDGEAEHIILAHLSGENNHPEIAKLAALESLRARASFSSVDWEKCTSIAFPQKPTEWIQI